MNNPDNVYFVVHKIVGDSIIESVRYEEDPFNLDVISKTPAYFENVSFEISDFSSNSNMLRINPPRVSENDDSFKCIKIENLYMYCDLDGNAEERKLHDYPGKINIPTMIRCQNCETNFPTKYQYQRHQCEFNAEKVVLKPDVDINDIEKGVRIKYDCATCGKQFVSKNNLERHQASHENMKDNICEHCNKQFVSENRLRIHKENHCKKAGDVSKFYRSDVAVWKCKKCHEVFSSVGIADHHLAFCKEITDTERSEIANKNNEVHYIQHDATGALLDFSQTLNSNIEKILTEILLQCEFCNRTYADKNLLMLHQRQHTTEKNYECVNCEEIFESYVSASQHWLKKCTDYANLFYLPKLAYCEYCDRTFKSHEILYSHKIKKKHYSTKLHKIKCDETESHNEIENEDEDQMITVNADKPEEKKVLISKLIEDVLKTLDLPMKTTDENNKDNETIIKVEHLSDASANRTDEEPEKKKRGRKRKWPRQLNGKKKVNGSVDDKYKYQCERCVNIFTTVYDLETHREKEHAANFNCEECGQVLHSAKALLIHSRAHKSLKPYVCDTCGRSYSQTSHLWQHMRFHQGIKPFACPHEGCEARYTIRPDLKDHIRKVHTRERPFKCTVCNKCFLTGSVYYQHRLIHTNDRRYGCDVCQKRFFRADALNNHKRIHTDERPYPCGVCGREFRQKGDRNKHFRTQHPDVIQTIAL
ncbi:unnamed protein product [Brassicogethes aeneus]|uniref:C2H2-type domain-containing protein n=1 Tax=Brassicogethes aeneus TaxID=1431903 RepID=A0A9P0FDK4_BRAAE|nr:unnamed protein product [Brassicogethes aeneus]